MGNTNYSIVEIENVLSTQQSIKHVNEGEIIKTWMIFEYPYNKLQRLSSELGSEHHGEDHNNNTNKNQQDDNEFLITQHEIDNETTIEEEEKLGIEMTYQGKLG